MIHSIIIQLLFFIIPINVWAQNYEPESSQYEVFDHTSGNAYIVQKTTPGVFLGQMLRNIGLQPDWRNRQWIRLIHYANPQSVDSSGEIIDPSQPIKLPIDALTNLKGFNQLEPKLVVSEQNPIPTAPTEPPVREEQVIVTEEVIHDSQQSFKTIFALDILAGGGAEKLFAKDKIGNDTTLTTEANIVGFVRVHSQINIKNQFGFSARYSYKTYSPPPSIFYIEDKTSLFNFRYNWGYKVINNIYLRIIGQSESRNFVQFPNNNIRILNFWLHSAGIQADAPLFNILDYQLIFKIAGRFVYANTADFDIGPGYQGTLSLEVLPQELQSGFVLGLSGDYFSQIPNSFNDHNSLELLGYLGYRF